MNKGKRRNNRVARMFRITSQKLNFSNTINEITTVARRNMRIKGLKITVNKIENRTTLSVSSVVVKRFLNSFLVMK